MKKFGKVISLALAAAMVISLSACGQPKVIENGDKVENTVTDNKDTGKTNVTSNNDKALSVINIGTWWTQPYDSDDAIEDATDWNTNQDAAGDSADTLATKAFNRNVCQLKFANVNKIEEKYNMKYYWQNLTYAGTQDSINTSILAGTPDCELYLVDTGMAIPAQLNGLAADLKTILPADADILTSQTIMSYLDLGDGKVSIIKRVSAEAQVEATYPLGFNMQMLEDNGLEDPRVLWEQGKWDWDTFIAYCQKLTQDTDGDGQIDQWGYCGYENETFEQLMMSNGANIAKGQTQTLDSAETIEALQMMSDMYNTYNICYPYDFEDPSNSMRNQYTQGNVAFFPIACWIASGNGDYDETKSTKLTWDTAYVRWPVGPSGDKETNAGKNLTAGEFYIIPANVPNVEQVYNFLYDYWNWFDGDVSLRDNKMILNWWYNSTAWEDKLRVENFDVMNDCGFHTTFDLWSSVGIYMDFQSLIRGEVTPAQMAETYKQEYQAALDAYFN